MSETAVVDETADSLSPCALCGRKFKTERLEKHQKICNKTKESDKRRKKFDSHKQRADLEAVNGFPVTPPSRLTTAGEDKKPNKTSNWRAKHEEFLRTVRQARGETVVDHVNDSPRVPVGYIECKFCGRNFSDKAADRHIQWCKEQKARIPRSANNTKALERMKARTKYKPSPNKSSPKSETPSQPTTRSLPPTPPVGRKDLHPPTPPTTRRGSQPPTPTVSRKTTSVVHSRRPSPPKSLPNSLKSTKASPKATPKNRSTPSPPTKLRSDRHRIESLSRPKNASPDSLDHMLKHTEPVMKFKEKFPNYLAKGDTNLIKNEQLRQLLKKTETYNGGPRTVPGVRTGGMSPIKNENTNFNHQNGHYTEEEELEKLKTKIEEMYLNGSTKYKPNSIHNNNNNNNHFETNNSQSTTRGSTGGSNGSSAESSSIQTPPRDNSGGSDGTRSTTSSQGLPKFCHQCGTKYPSTIAKYCYECGSRRLGTVGPFLSN